MKNILKFMFRIIQSEINNERLIDADIEHLLDADYESLYTLSKAHDLAHIVGYSLLNNKILTPKKEVAKKFQKQYMLAIYRYENIQYELNRIKETLEETQIPFIPLKGSVIRQYYPEPWMRTSCDIDILVHEEDLDNTIDFLVDKLQYQTDRTRNYHDVSLFSPSGVHLELHFNIQENIENLDSILSQIWNYAYPKNNNSFEYLVSNEFLIYHLIAHMSYHFVTGGCGIRSFLDLYLCNQKMSYNEREVMDLCKQSKIDTFYRAVKKTYTVWFDGAQEDDLTEQITNYVVYGGVYGNSQNKVAAGSKKSGNKFNYVLSRVFIPYKTLIFQYPKLQNRKFLLPYYEICRWCRMIFKGRLKSSVKELNTVVGLSKDDSFQVSNLIKQLGL